MERRLILMARATFLKVPGSGDGRFDAVLEPGHDREYGRVLPDLGHEVDIG